MRTHIKDRGASAVEYGLLVAAIAAVLVGVTFVLGGAIKASFSTTCQDIANSASISGPAQCSQSPPPVSTDTSLNPGAGTGSGG